MIKGMYAAASAMVAGVNQQSVLAHNIANLDTPGFKQVMDSVGDFLKAPVVHPPADINGTKQMAYIGNLGLGVESGPQITDYSDGALMLTSQPLDMAIQGPGFFRVLTPDGERYTRDGRFSIDAENQLVTVDGFKVLDESGQPIQFTEQGDLTVKNDGTLMMAGQESGKIGLASFLDPQNELVREKDNTYSAVDGPTGTDLGYVQQNYLEGSNVNPADTMTKMIQVARQYEAAQKLVQTQDELLGRVIQTLGRL